MYNLIVAVAVVVATMPPTIVATTNKPPNV